MKAERITSNGLTYWQINTWAERGLPHAFFGKTINLKESPSVWSAHFASPLFLLRQEHGVRIADALEGGLNKRPVADAWFIPPEQLLDTSGAFGIITADCTPILLTTKDGRMVGAAHCGWRGTVENLLGLLIEAAYAAGAGPEELELAIGPAADSCCYEVGEEVVSALRQAARFAAIRARLDFPKTIVQNRAGRYYANIRDLLEFQAISYGISSSNSTRVGHCTICSDDFFSYRREKEQSGRQVSVIGTKLSPKTS